MVTSAIAPDIDRYWNSIGGAAPVYTPEEQRSALTQGLLFTHLSLDGREASASLCAVNYGRGPSAPTPTAREHPRGVVARSVPQSFRATAGQTGPRALSSARRTTLTTSQVSFTPVLSAFASEHSRRPRLMRCLRFTPSGDDSATSGNDSARQQRIVRRRSHVLSGWHSVGPERGFRHARPEEGNGAAQL
jgi:hypothetical protein